MLRLERVKIIMDNKKLNKLKKSVRRSMIHSCGCVFKDCVLNNIQAIKNNVSLAKALGVSIPRSLRELSVPKEVIDYYKKNPGHYERYSHGSGRKAFIEEHWGEKS